MRLHTYCRHLALFLIILIAMNWCFSSVNGGALRTKRRPPTHGEKPGTSNWRPWFSGRREYHKEFDTKDDVLNYPWFNKDFEADGPRQQSR